MTVLRDMEVLDVSHKYNLSPGSMKAQALMLFERGYSTRDVGYLLFKYNTTILWIMENETREIALVRPLLRSTFRNPVTYCLLSDTASRGRIIIRCFVKLASHASLILELE